MILLNYPNFGIGICCQFVVLFHICVVFVNVFDGFSSGLAAAYKLKSKGVNVTLFEADGRVGGKLRSVMHNGLIWDEGANTMVVSCLLVN